MAATHQSLTHMNGTETERGMSSWGRGAPGTYLLTQDKQGQPVTEQKGGSHRQKENNKKAHLNHSSKISHTKPREARRFSEAKAPASRTDSCLGSIWTLSEHFSGTAVQPGHYSAVDTDSMASSGRGATESSGRRIWDVQPTTRRPFLTASSLTFCLWSGALATGTQRAPGPWQEPLEGMGAWSAVPPASTTHPASGASPHGQG